MGRTSRFLGALGVVWALAVPLPAQAAMAQADASARPRIGLVLGGGGARGLAHLAVLKELEQLRIPISCIAGTSAGALIGGIYATGRPLDEVMSQIRNADWNALLAGGPVRQSMPYSAKLNDDKNLAGITFGVDANGVRLPRSAVGSQHIERFLRELTEDAYAPSFSDLAIPFKAVATNLVTGLPRVFDRGDLATAMHASMAVPGVFDVVELDGSYYIDGMLVRNLPIQDVKGECADRVIAVDVGMPMLGEDAIHSLVDVIMQSLAITTRQNVVAQRALLGPSDILIQPHLAGFSPASFRAAPQIIDQASHFDAETLARLRELSLPEAEYARWRAGLRKHYEASRRDHFDRVEIAQGERTVPTEVVRQIVDGNSPPQTGAELQQRIDTLFASGEYDRVDYRISEENGQRVATVHPLERSIGPNHLRLGLETQLDTHRGSEVALLANYQMTRLNRWGAQWRNDIRLGNETRIQSEFFQPIARSPWFVAPKASVGWHDVPIYDDAGLRAFDISQRNSMLGLDFGASLGSLGEFRVGPYMRHAKQEVESGIFAGERSAARDRGVQASLTIDQLDNPRFPRSGYYAHASYLHGRAESVGGDPMSTRVLHLSGDAAETFGDTTWRLSYRHTAASDQALELDQLGGFMQLSGLRTNQIVGTKSSFGRLMIYRQISPLLPALGSGTYLGTSFEAGRVYNIALTGANTPIIPSASLWLGVDTFMGPLYTGVGWSNYRGGQIAGYLYLGNAR